MTSFTPDQYYTDLVDKDDDAEHCGYDVGSSPDCEVATLFLPIDLFMTQLQSSRCTTNSFTDSGWESFKTQDVSENDLSPSSALTPEPEDETTWNISGQNTPTKRDLVYVDADTSFHCEDFGFNSVEPRSPADDGFFSISLDLDSISMETCPVQVPSSHHDDVTSVYNWFENVALDNSQDFDIFKNSIQSDASESFELIELVTFNEVVSPFDDVTNASPFDDVIKSYIVVEMP